MEMEFRLGRLGVLHEEPPFVELESRENNNIVIFPGEDLDLGFR